MLEAERHGMASILSNLQQPHGSREEKKCEAWILFIRGCDLRLTSQLLDRTSHPRGPALAGS